MKVCQGPEAISSADSMPTFSETSATCWAIGRSKLLTPDGLRGLTNVTFYALFPALLFRSMSKVRVEALSFDILVVFFGTALLLYFPLMVLGRVLGMRQLADELHRRHPLLRFGTFNPRLASDWYKDVPPWVGAEELRKSTAAAT